MTTYPSVKFDLQHRMLSVRLNDGQIAWTDQLDDAHLVDVDAEGRVVGIDVMTLDDFKIDEMAERFGFTDQIPAIKAAIQSVMAPTTVGSSGKSQVIQGTRVVGVPTSARTEYPSEPVVETIVK
jgi:hypothetical protein